MVGCRHSCLRGRAPAQEIGASIEVFGRRKGDARFPVEVMFSPVELGGERMLVATLRDLSLKRSAEMRARTPARRGKSGTPLVSDTTDGKVPLAGMTLDSIGDALVSMDLSGNVYFVNQAAEELTGDARARIHRR